MMSRMKRGYSTPHLTRIEGCPDRNSAKPGMAFFANSGPFGETCGNCQHLDRAGRRKGQGRCLMFRKLTGRCGEKIDPGYSACKYFEVKPKPPPIVPRHKPTIGEAERLILAASVSRESRVKP
jgi:hypothetical protein